jgi:Ca2+-binding RTX toxin-like protein
MADPIILTDLSLQQAKAIEEARLLQLVAESKLSLTTPQDTVVEMLQKGNQFTNPVTGETFGKLQMTQKDAEKIAENYTLLDRQDTSSGLTVMYLLDTRTQEVVRVMASTQYAEPQNGGDAARDFATNRQIQNVGIPANQLADLERAELVFRANPEYANFANVPFKAVGYSLSGALQLGLEKLHPEWTKVSGNILFNPSGVGTLPEGKTWREFVDLQQQTLNDPASFDLDAVGVTYGYGSDTYVRLAGLRDAAIFANAGKPISAYGADENSVDTAQTRYADAVAQTVLESCGRTLGATVDSSIPTDKYLVVFNHAKGMDMEGVVGGELPATRLVIPISSVPLMTQLGPLLKVFGTDSGASDFGYSHSIMPSGDALKVYMAFKEMSPSMTLSDFKAIIESGTGSVAGPWSSGLGNVWDAGALPTAIASLGKALGVDIPIQINATLAGLNNVEVSEWNEQALNALKTVFAAKQAENPGLLDLGIHYQGNNPTELARLALEDSDAGTAARFAMDHNLPLVTIFNSLSAADKEAYALNAKTEADWLFNATAYSDTMSANRLGQGTYNPLPNTSLLGNMAREASSLEENLVLAERIVGADATISSVTQNDQGIIATWSNGTVEQVHMDGSISMRRESAKFDPLYGNGLLSLNEIVTSVIQTNGQFTTNSDLSFGGKKLKSNVCAVDADGNLVVTEERFYADKSITATYADGEISSLTVTPSVGATHYLDLLVLTATERQNYGFFTQQEVASRLGQLGLADANQFQQNGFAAAGVQNTGLNALQCTVGGNDYIWSNGSSNLLVNAGNGWTNQGNGAVGDIGGRYTLGQILTQSITYIGGAMTRLSPLVLDLDGDGVATDLTHAYDGGRVFFDIDADGFAERIGWVKADDGLLAMDVNGNGRIDDITELYGDDQMPAFQKLRLLDTNGDSRIDLSDLAATDTNGDGQIDAADGPYARLRVWQDANQDGITQEGELKTLASLDIQSISTNDHNDERWANENYISSSTTYTRLENGIAVEREIADVHFLNDNANTWQLGAHSQVYGSDIQIDLEAILLPLSRGYGTLPSLHLAMSANPELKRMVRELAYLPLDRLNEAAGRVGEIMLEWAGVRGKDPASHATGDGPRIDGRKVDFVEQFTGLTWAQRGVTSMVGEDASIGIKKTWNGIEAAMLHRMLAQGALHAVMPNASYDFATDKIILSESLSAILARASTLAPATADAAREFWTQLGGILIGGKEELGQSTAAINDAVSALAGQNLYLGEHVVAPSNFGDPDWGLYTGNGTNPENLVGGIYSGDSQANQILGSGAGEYFFGGAGNDSVGGGAGDDYLRGDDGNDTLDGGAGEDALRGGTGSDLLLGGAGNDMLEGFEGNDSIYGGDGYDMIAGYDTLLLRQSTAGGYVNLASGVAHGNESEGDLITNFEAIRGSGYADVLIGNDAGNTINGEGGDDVLVGGGGNDSLFATEGHQRYFGGTGDDWLWGYDGSDQIDGGAGFDHVAYSHPFAANGVVVDLSLGRGTGGVATGDTYTGIEGVWGVRGGDDVLIGDAGDNVLFGNDGNDILIGGAGNDRLQFSSGTQHLFGQGGSDRFEAPAAYLQSYVDGVYVDGGDASNPYVIAPEQAVFIHDFDVSDPAERIVLQDLAMNAVVLRQRGDDTAIELTGGRVLYVLGVMPGLLTAANFVLPAAVADVTVGPPLDQTGRVLAGSDADNKLVGGVGNDVLTGHGGRDALTAGQGSDQLSGGDGDDLLIGGVGADTLDGGTGFDTVRYDDSWTGVTIDLVSGTGLGGTAQGDQLQGVEKVVGSNRDDTLLGNNTVSTDTTLWESLEGLNGDDVLNGRDGRNRLTGGGGADRYVIEAHVAGFGTAITEITDFDMDNPDEKIDLSAIDFSGKRLVAEWSADRTKLKFFTGNGVAGVDALYKDALTLTNLQPWDEGVWPKLPELATKFVWVFSE